MDERLKRLIARREQAATERRRLLESRKAIVDNASEEAREDLSDEEDEEFRTITGKVKEWDEELRKFDERITELADEIERDKKVTEGAAAVRRAQARVSSVNEARTYEQGNGQSYFKDLMRMTLRMDGDGASASRLERHALDVRISPEYRDLSRTDGSGGFFVPPVYLMSQYAELARAGRAVANLVHSEPLPGGTDNISIPIVATGTATAIQTADNAAVQEVDLTDSSVSAGVRTIAGQQDVAIQLLDQSPVAFDQIIFNDLVADYATKVDLQVIAGSNASGQVKGILGSTGITTVTYTDTSPTPGELYSKLADAIQQVHTTRFRAPNVIAMHPRRWAWFLAALDTNGRPLISATAPGQNQIGSFGGVVSQQVVGEVQGLPVVTDPNIPTNLGAGTNEDRILVMKADDLLLWESGIKTRVLPDIGSATLTVRLQVYGYIAFSAERYPKSTAVIAGTGLISPVF